MDSNAGKVALAKKSIKLGGTSGVAHKDDDLVEFESVEQLIQLAILLSLAQLDVVLLQTVEGELGLVVDVDLERVLHELLADWPDLLREGGTEHHDLLLGWCGTEDLLHIAAHVFVERVSEILPIEGID